MRPFLLFGVLLLLVSSCATKVPYTDKIRDDFDLNEKRLKQVQFYTSSEIILYRASSSGSRGTQDGGVLVENSSRKEDRIIIPPNTKCVFDGFEEDGTMLIRFETGANRVLRFKVKPNGNNRYYLEAIWKDGKGEIQYAGSTYQASAGSSGSFLLVPIKKLQRSQRQDRIVKGVKVN
jgi:hypothetical protein